MLVILYGPISRVGKACKEYFVDHGFQYVEKLNYSEAPRITTKYGKRNYVSKEEFLEYTDSLFRYEVGGILVGFNQKQIDDAVYGDGNSLMTLSTGDIGFLGKIKQVYGDKVCLIYTYIDDTTLSTIIEEENDDADERVVRRQIGRDVKAGYLQHQEIFDHVVIYGGEDSSFHLERLRHQFEKIFASKEKAASVWYAGGDVCIVGMQEDAGVEEPLRAVLEDHGITVFTTSQLLQQEDNAAAMMEAVRHAKAVLPIISTHTRQDDMAKLLTVAYESGCVVVPLMTEKHLLSHPTPLSEVLRLDCLGVDLYDGEQESIFRTLADDLKNMLAYETALKDTAHNAEMYLQLGMYDDALQWQQQHTEWCYKTDKYFVRSTYLKYYFHLVGFQDEIVTQSLMKEFRIRMKLGHWQPAFDVVHTIVDLAFGFYLTDSDMELLLLCCIHNGMGKEETKQLVCDLLNSYQNEEEETEKNLAIAENIMAQYDDIAARAQEESAADTGDRASADREEDIARYGQGAIELFEDILYDCRNSLSRQDLIIGYQRVLDYCIYLGVKGDVAKTCVERIAQLKADTEERDEAYSGTNAALKIYLGQALPQPGEYDVFLSFKSEDTAMAAALYEFLTKHGKKVFFSKETLPQLGESEYKDAIFDAIDRSKHMLVVASNPDYLKTPWVKREWDAFDNELLEQRKEGNLLLVLTDSVATDKGKLPTQLRKYEIVKMSEYRQRLLAYLR